MKILTIPRIKPGRPPLNGYKQQVIVLEHQWEAIQEYRLYCKNKTGVYPSFNETVRAILDKGLEALGLTPDESNDDDKDS